MYEKATKYILYARKSSEAEDKQLGSIPSQVKEVKNLANKNGITITEVLTEAQSAKGPGRPVFNAMMSKIGAGEADGIVCWKMNRLSRNPVDSGQISWLLQRGAIKHILTYERSYYPDDNVLLMAVEQGMANQFIRDLSIDSRRGLKTKAEKGWLPAGAPLGYCQHPYKNKGEKEIICDNERFEIVKKHILAVAYGEMTPPEAYKTAVEKYGLTNRKGGKLSISNWYAMLNNTFYYGEFEYPKGSGTWYPGKHKAMITQREFERIQLYLGRKGTTRPRSHHFLYRGLMVCGNCGASITAEHKTKKTLGGNTHLYIYYHCTKRKDPNCTEKSVEEKELVRQIVEELESISIPTSFKEWAVNHLEKYAAEEAKTNRKLREAHERHYKNIDTKLDELLDLRLEGKVSDEDYQKKKLKLSNEKEELEKILESPIKKTWVDDFKEALNVAENVRQAFENGDEGTQKRILSSLGSKLIIQEKKFQIQAPNPILCLKSVTSEIKAIDSRFEPLEMAQQKEKLELSYSSSPIKLTIWDDFRTINLSPLRIYMDSQN